MDAKQCRFLSNSDNRSEKTSDRISATTKKLCPLGFRRKISWLGGLIYTLGRISGWSLYQYVFASSWLCKAWWAPQDSDFWLPQVCSLGVFFEAVQGSLSPHVEVAAKQGGLVWKRRYYRVSTSYQGRVKAAYRFLLKLFPDGARGGRLAQKWAVSKLP